MVAGGPTGMVAGGPTGVVSGGPTGTGAGGTVGVAGVAGGVIFGLGTALTGRRTALRFALAFRTTFFFA